MQGANEADGAMGGPFALPNSDIYVSAWSSVRQKAAGQCVNRGARARRRISAPLFTRRRALSPLSALESTLALEAPLAGTGRALSRRRTESRARPRGFANSREYWAKNAKAPEPKPRGSLFTKRPGVFA